MCCTAPRRASELGTKITLPHSIRGSPAARKSVAGIIDLFVADLVGTGGTEMEQRVLARQKEHFQVGSEDWNDVLFRRQRIR